LRTSADTNLLITTDMLMDGRLFRLEQDGPRAVGYKALGVNLSDIAAMADVPRAARV
jgi:thiamine-monophosphate kinase